MATQKIVGQACENNCGGKYVKNPHTGKIFCENKCWLNNGQGSATEPFRTPVENKKAEEAKWTEISRRKVRHGFSIEAFKLGMDIDDLQTKIMINRWTYWVMKGE